MAQQRLVGATGEATGAQSPAPGQAEAAARGLEAGPTAGARVLGLDGVRALAVLAVVAFHLGMREAPGGFLGVDVFFVLSGYLITDLLVARQSRAGGLDLRGFWARRARRLLPALAVVLVAVAAATAVVEPGQLAGLRPALAAALTYSSNWYQAFHHLSYFDSFGPPPPLQHLWSLAIEEQFYLVWPFLLLAALTFLRARRARALAAWLAALASATAMALLYQPGGDPSRVYYGTDTHATGLLIGAALALTWPLATLAAAPAQFARRLDYLGLVGLATLGWAVGHLSGGDPAVYPFGLAAASMAAAGLTAAAAAPGAVSALLSLPPLRWIGVRSYGIYLWHWPVIALTAAALRPRPVSPWLWPVEAAAAVALAAASWRWIEQPVLRHGLRGATRRGASRLVGAIRAAERPPARVLPVLGSAAALTVACTAGYGVLDPPPSATSGVQQQIARGEQVSAASRTRAPWTAPAPTSDPASGPGPAAPGRGPRKIRGWQVTAVGDSVMLASAAQMQSVLPGIYIDAQVSRQMWAGLDVLRSLASKGRLRRVVVVGLGTNGTVTAGQIRELIRLAGPRRALVLVNTYEARPWERADNAVIAAAARRYPNVVLANWFKTIDHRAYLLWPDEVHPRPQGAKVYARMLYQAVQDTWRGSGAAPPAPSALPAGVPVAARGKGPPIRQPARLAR